MIEHGHLRIIQALDEQGTLTGAAGQLCLSQSALSHQIRHLEQRLGVPLWKRRGRRLQLTPAGELLLHAARQVLPVLTQAERMLKACAEGRLGVLRIGVECYPCYRWLTRVVGDFLRELPDVDIDIVQDFPFSGMRGLRDQHIDVLITPDPENQPGIRYEPLAAYRLVVLLTANHPLAGVEALSPARLSEETLLSFPVPLERLDIVSRFLAPAGYPAPERKTIASIEIMLQLVALGRGVCVLPEWLADEAIAELGLVKKATGIDKQLLLAMREEDSEIGYMRRFVETGRDLAARYFRTNSRSVENAVFHPPANSS